MWSDRGVFYSDSCDFGLKSFTCRCNNCLLLFCLSRQPNFVRHKLSGPNNCNRGPRICTQRNLASRSFWYVWQKKFALHFGNIISAYLICSPHLYINSIIIYLIWGLFRISTKSSHQFNLKEIGVLILNLHSYHSVEAMYSSAHRYELFNLSHTYQCCWLIALAICDFNKLT